MQIHSFFVRSVELSTKILSEVECIFESLILAQDERWRRALGMQIKGTPQGVTGGRVSNAQESAWKLDIASRKVG